MRKRMRRKKQVGKKKKSKKKTRILIDVEKEENWSTKSYSERKKKEIK